MSKNLISERQALNIFSIKQRIEMGLSEKKNSIAASDIAQRDFNTKHLSYSDTVQNKKTALALVKVHLNQKVADLLLNPHTHDGFPVSDFSENYGMAYVRYTSCDDLGYILRAYLSEDEAEAYIKSCLEDCLSVYKDLLDADNALLKVEADEEGSRDFYYTLTMLVNAPAYHASEKKQYIF